MFRHYFILILSCLVGLGALVWISNQYGQEEEKAWDWREELKQIDEEMKRAQDLKNRYLSEAARAEDNALRWQFQQHLKQEAKRAFERAELKRQAAQMLQARIDVLEARKAQILQEHPEANEFERST